MPFAGLKLSFNIKLGAFFDVIFAEFYKVLIEDGDIVPLRGLAFFARLFVPPCFRCGDREVADFSAIGKVPNFGILADIADKDHFIDRACHLDTPDIKRRAEASIYLFRNNGGVLFNHVYKTRKDNFDAQFAFTD